MISILLVPSLSYNIFANPNWFRQIVDDPKNYFYDVNVSNVSRLSGVYSSNSTSNFFFEDMFYYGIAGLTLKKISYDSYTHKLSAYCFDLFRMNNLLLDNISTNNTTTSLCGNSKVSFNYTKILNSTEERNLKQSILETRFFESPAPYGGEPVFDGSFRSLNVTIDDQSKYFWWSTFGNVIIPEPIARTLQIISQAANK